MKNNPADDDKRNESPVNGSFTAITEGVTATVWTPDYVTRLRQNIHRCSCPGCDSASPLLQFRWKNHVRHSADISCRRAAAEILCLTASCTIAFSEDAAEHLPALPAESLWMNQRCLRLFAVFQDNPVLLLYVLGRFIREAGRLAPSRREALLETWLQPDARQRLIDDFIRQPQGTGYPSAALNSLHKLPLSALAAGDARLPKWEEIRRMNEAELRQSWTKLQKASGLRREEQRKILGNYLFYELCHTIFPGNSPAEWENNFARLCQRLLSLNLLLLVLPPDYGKESVSALLAASLYAARVKTFAGSPEEKKAFLSPIF